MQENFLVAAQLAAPREGFNSIKFRLQAHPPAPDLTRKAGRGGVAPQWPWEFRADEANSTIATSDESFMAIPTQKLAPGPPPTTTTGLHIVQQWKSSSPV
jgi:hypothetical protein